MANFTTIQSSLGTNEFTTNTERSIVKAATFSSGSPQVTQGYARYTIDATGLPAGAVIEVRRYLTAGPSGTQRQVDLATIRAAQVIEVDMGLVVEPWDVTIKLIAGTSPQTIGYVVKQDTNDVNAATAGSAAVTSIQSGLALSATALSTVQWTNTRAALQDNLDVAVSTRAPGSTAVSNVDYTSGRAAHLDADISSRAPASTAVSNADLTPTRAAKLDNADVAVSTRAPATDTSTLLSRLTSTRAGLLDNLDVASSALGSAITAVAALVANVQGRIPDALDSGSIKASVQAVASGATTAIAAAVWATISEGTETVLQAFRLIVARAAGGGGVQDGDGLYAFKSADGSKTRVGLQRTGNAITVATRDGT